MNLNLFSSLLLSLIFCSSTSSAQSNKLLHLDFNAGILTGSYAYPNLEAGISIDLPFVTAKISHSNSFEAMGNYEYYWDQRSPASGDAIRKNNLGADWDYTNFSVFSNIDLLGYDIFLGPGLFYRHKVPPEGDYIPNDGPGVSLVGGYRFDHFNISVSHLQPFGNYFSKTILKLGYRIGLGKELKSSIKRIKINTNRQSEVAAQNKFRIEIGFRYAKALSSKYSSLKTEPFMSLQYYLSDFRKLYFNSSLMGEGGYGADDLPFHTNINDTGDTTYITNFKLLAFQSVYHLGYNLILKRDNLKDLDFEMGGGLFATRSRDQNFIKETWNVETNGFGIFANAQYRYKMFATGLNINIPVVNKLPASISLYTSIGINFKRGGLLSNFLKGKNKE